MKKWLCCLTVFLIIGCQSDDKHSSVVTKTLTADDPNPKTTLVNWISDESVDEIHIEAGTYNALGTITVNRDNHLRIRGTSSGYNANDASAGVQSIETTLNDTRFRFENRPSNLTFQNLKITADTQGSIVIYDDTQTAREGQVNLINVHLEGGIYGVIGRAGLGGTIRHSYISNFKNIGVLFDRHGKEKLAKPIVIDRSKFSPDTSNGKLSWENRSVSFDAGNSEFPYLWDYQWSKIIDSHFVNSGFACSRCQNMTISGNTFTYSEGIDGIQSMESIHLEEFSSNFEIHNNTFEFNSSGGRGIYMDLELQTAHDVNISGSIIHGRYGRFFMAESAQNVSITKTTLTSTASGDHFIHNQSSFHHRGEGLEDQIGTKGDITFELPSNYDETIHGAIHHAYDQDWVEDGFIPTEGVYYIENVETGKRAYANLSAQHIALGDVIDSAANYKWQLTKVHSAHRFFNFTINNVADSDIFWEVDQGFTANHYHQDDFPKFSIKNYTYADGEIDAGHINAPSWVIRKAAHTNADGIFYLHPGGNERRSRVGYVDNELILQPAMAYDDNNSLMYVDLESEHQDQKWRLVPAS
ncbi:hypothetical protein [Vibrio sp. WXL103]|uniref:hypothetical protein n=1 Tax=Vibrio sp. WXL103 TaxID=3450710 RepID=UPI003EC6520B